VSPGGWTLRPVTAQDRRDFVAELNRVAIGPYLEMTFGWDDAGQRAYFGFVPVAQTDVDVTMRLEPTV
jgi:hypothetical protein